MLTKWQRKTVSFLVSKYGSGYDNPPVLHIFFSMFGKGEKGCVVCGDPTLASLGRPTPCIDDWFCSRHCPVCDRESGLKWWLP